MSAYPLVIYQCLSATFVLYSRTHLQCHSSKKTCPINNGYLSDVLRCPFKVCRICVNVPWTSYVQQTYRGNIVSYVHWVSKVGSCGGVPSLDIWIAHVILYVFVKQKEHSWCVIWFLVFFVGIKR